MVKPATVITALVVGILVTIVAGVFPAVRASRVPPLAAMRDVAVESTALSKPRLGIGTALSVIGLGLVLRPRSPAPASTSSNAPVSARSC